VGDSIRHRHDDWSFRAVDSARFRGERVERRIGAPLACDPSLSTARRSRDFCANRRFAVTIRGSVDERRVGAAGADETGFVTAL
jgi:hypothetical protein